MSLSIASLKKEIYNKAIELGVTEIVLHFSGGSDEGYLNVEVNPYNHDLADQIEEWAWSVYSYSGAGEGTDYGDIITYDLVNERASSQEWYMRREEGEVIENAFDDLESETNNEDENNF
jgi:hypothetical protein